MQVSIVILSALPLCFLLMSIYWILFLISRILQLRKYIKVALQHTFSATNSSGNMFEQAAYHHQTDVQKYKFLILIIIAEGYAITMNALSQYITANYLAETGIRGITDLNCTRNEISRELVINSVINIIWALQNVAYLYIILLTVLLMQYLTQRIKKIQFSYKSKSRCFIAITVVLSFLIIVSSTVYINRIIFPIIGLIYLYIFLRGVKRFEATLLQRAGERLTQYGRNKEEHREYRRFKITMLFYRLGFILIILANFLIDYPEFLTSVIAYLRCHSPLLQAFTASKYYAIGEEVASYSTLAGYALAYLGGISAFSPFVFITFYTWYVLISKVIRGKSNRTHCYHIGGELTAPFLK